MPALCLQAAQHLKPDARLLQPPSFVEVREGRPSEPEAQKATEPAHKMKKKKFFSEVGISSECTEGHCVLSPCTAGVRCVVLETDCPLATGFVSREGNKARPGPPF